MASPFQIRRSRPLHVGEKCTRVKRSPGEKAQVLWPLLIVSGRMILTANYDSSTNSQWLKPQRHSLFIHQKPRASHRFAPAAQRGRLGSSSFCPANLCFPVFFNLVSQGHEVAAIALWKRTSLIRGITFQPPPPIYSPSVSLARIWSYEYPGPITGKGEKGALWLP